MGSWIARWVISGIALAIVGQLGVGVSFKSVGALAAATVVIGLVNSVIRPIVLLITLPISCITLGGFALVVNSLLFFLAGNAVAGFRVDGVKGAILGPLLMSFFSTILNSPLIRPGEDDRR